MWLYPTLIRLDAVYAVLFKVAKHRVVDYPNLHRWLVDMYQLPVPGAMQVGGGALQDLGMEHIPISMYTKYHLCVCVCVCTTCVCGCTFVFSQ